jgi:hypothetical protein
MVNQSPQATNGMLVIESNGTWFDAQSPHNGYLKTDYADFDADGKQMQMHMNDYVFNTWLWAILNDEARVDVTRIANLWGVRDLYTDDVGKLFKDVETWYGKGRRCRIIVAPCVSDASEYFAGGLNASYHMVVELHVEKLLPNGTVINETAIAGEFRGFLTSFISIVDGLVTGKDF